MSKSDLLLSKTLLPHGEPTKFKSWPRVPSGWGTWVDRLEPIFGNQWKLQGLWHLIQISKVKISKQSVLLDGLLRFWSPSCNAFIFPFGPLSVTLFDISLLLDLPTLGHDSPYFINDPSAPELAPPRFCFPSYKAVVSQWGSLTGDPSPTEHVMFLWVLICHYIFCPASGKPSAELLPLASSLSTGKIFNLGIMLLGSVYRGLNSGVRNMPLSKLGGISWFVRVWAAAYFPEIFEFSSASTTLRTTTLMTSQMTASADDLIRYFQSLTLDAINLPSLSRSSILDKSVWVAHYPEIRKKSHDEIANVLLIPFVHHRFIIVDCADPRPLSANKTSWSFEFYNPALFPYQFGLSQAIPHNTLYLPIDITHLAAEITSGKFSKSTVELLSLLPEKFLNPIVEVDAQVAGNFTAWWRARFAEIVTPFLHPSGIIYLLDNVNTRLFISNIFFFL